MIRMWLRWSWRDLSRRWVQVAAIALVLALGTGTFAGLTSLTRWRIASNDASLELTRMWDLRAELPAGTEVSQGSLHAVLAELDHPEWVARAGERLVLPTLVDASAADPEGGTILVSGRLVGTELGGKHLDGDVAAEARIMGSIHLPHAAFPEQLDDLVGAQPGAGLLRHGQRESTDRLSGSAVCRFSLPGRCEALELCGALGRASGGVRCRH